MAEEKKSAFAKASADKKWKREFSAGGVVYKNDPSASPERSDGGQETGRLFILLIMPMGRNFGPPEGYWAFPKGKIDEGEDQSETAVREVEEETGVTGKIVEDLKSIKFFRNYDKTLKFVHYYLMEFVSGDTKDHDREVAQAEWVAIDEVLPRLKFDADKEIFERAKKALNV